VFEENKLMRVGRREFLEWIGVAAAIPFLPRFKEAGKMFGLISKLSVVPGKRDAMIAILKQSAADMPGCLSYVVAKDDSDENAIWITEVWDSKADHDASLVLPAVRKAMASGQTLASGFEKVAVTSPVWGTDLRASAR
jgi:quinol monooxygenase YgiN